MMTSKTKIGVISLGCVKNQVDTEVMLGVLSAECEFVSSMDEADIALINTCAFVNDAKQEAIDTILEAAQLKKSGTLKSIIVTGCLSERYREELTELLPEVDAFLGIAAYKDIAEAVLKVCEGKKLCAFSDNTLQDCVLPRVMTTAKPTAYIKIAEGCDNCCSYCVIPGIRGSYQSRRMEDILTEMVTLAQNGYSEIVLVAQDTTMYGMDIYDKPMLDVLLDKAAHTPGLKWLRVLYCYPERITESLIDVMIKHNTIVKYLDIPVQHFSNDVLLDMNRRGTCETIVSVIDMIRKKYDDFILRTTLITGFPGETDDDHAENLRMIKKLEFDRVGIFAYSQEEGTLAGEMPNQINEQVKESRRDELLDVQYGIVFKKNQARIGSICEVLVEGLDEESGMFYGRSHAEAPDADGKIFVETDMELLPGRFYSVEIVYAYDIDLKGVLAQ